MLSLLFFLVLDIALYFYLCLIKLNKKFLNLMEKYFFFLITIFISYALLAYIKNDFLIFVEYIKDATLLTLKIILILFLNVILFNNKNLLKLIPKKIKIRVNFVINIFYFSMNFLNDLIKKYKKFELLKNIDKILLTLITGVIKESLNNEV